MKTVLVTGGIGSGKSAVCRILEARGIPVYDSDRRTKDLYRADAALLDRISREFGAGMILADGSLDRKALASLVFEDKNKLERLESIVHPCVLQDFMKWREGQKAQLVAFESAIALNLPSFMDLMDMVLLVDADLDLRVSRASDRDGTGREAVLLRASAQKFDNVTGLPLYKINNNGTSGDLESEVLRWLDKFKLTIK